MSEGKRTIGWWMRQEEYRERMIKLIFAGELRRPPTGLKYSVYQIVEFSLTATMPLATVSLFDLSPATDRTGKRDDLITINLRNYQKHEEIGPKEVGEIMCRHGLETQYLRHRDYIHSEHS
jgi:hypothetical protein